MFYKLLKLGETVVQIQYLEFNDASKSGKKLAKSQRNYS
jgi:hypothetical protein